jgi:hypothetical protein
VIRHPTILKDIVQGKSKQEIRAKVTRLDQERMQKETIEFMAYLKRTSPYYANSNEKLKLNKVCCIEDWENSEMKEALSELKNAGLPGFINRKPWEWALGIVAMRRFDKLNKNSVAVGVGSGKEDILFYLANRVDHVYATDLYEGKDWKQAPADFPTNPTKYAPFPYKEDSLTVLRMNGTKLEFPSENFDIAFLFLP